MKSFRLWNESKKEWYTEHDCLIELDGTITQIIAHSENDGVCKYDFEPRADLKLVQHTGLNDKKGGSIREGDITISSEGDLDKVVFMNGAFFLVPINRTFKPEFLGDYHKHVEVVGNIFDSNHILVEESK